MVKLAEIGIPVYIITDLNLGGYKIYLCHKYSTITGASSYEQLGATNIVWVGLSPSDLTDNLRLYPDFFDRISQQGKKKLRSLKLNKYLNSREKAQIWEIERFGRDVELQELTKFLYEEEIMDLNSSKFMSTSDRES